MIRALLIVLLLATSVQALELTYQADEAGQLLTDEAGFFLMDENGIPDLAASVVRAPIRTAHGYIAPIIPGTEFATCDVTPLSTPTLNPKQPFLYAESPEWFNPFYAAPGLPWATKLELINYNGGNTDYSGFIFETIFLPTGSAPMPITVQTRVIETIVDGVITSTVQTDWPWWHMQPLPFGIELGTQWALPSDWKTIYDPCYGRPGTLELCRYQYGIWPGEFTGDDTNGTRTYLMSRTVYYDVAPYYNNEIPVVVDVTATPGFITLSMTAEQTAEMAGWFGKLQLVVLYPEDSADYPPIRSYSKNYLNGIPMIFLPRL